MLTAFFLFLIIGAAYYVCTFEHGRSFMVSSVPYQVWYGTCQQICLKPQPLEIVPIGIDQNQQGPSNVQLQQVTKNCPCPAKCHCDLAEKFFKMVSPITKVYTKVANCPEMGLNFIAPAQLCHNECRRRARFVSETRGHLENFTFCSEEEEEKRNIRKEHAAKAIAIMFSKKDKNADPNTTDQISTSKKQATMSRLVIKDPDKSSNVQEAENVSGYREASRISNCSRCSENNKTCLKNCPKAQRKT